MDFITKNLLALWVLVILICIASAILFFSFECKPPDPNRIIDLSGFSCSVKKVASKTFLISLILSIAGGGLFVLYKRNHY